MKYREPTPELSENQKPALNNGQDVIPFSLPLSIVRWFFYSICFANLLIPFRLTPWQMVCGGLILGWFASQLNALINKK